MVMTVRLAISINKRHSALSEAPGMLVVKILAPPVRINDLEGFGLEPKVGLNLTWNLLSTCK